MRNERKVSHSVWQCAWNLSGGFLHSSIVLFLSSTCVVSYKLRVHNEKYPSVKCKDKQTVQWAMNIQRKLTFKIYDKLGAHCISFYRVFCRNCCYFAVCSNGLPFKWEFLRIIISSRQSKQFCITKSQTHLNSVAIWKGFIRVDFFSHWYHKSVIKFKMPSWDCTFCFVLTL